MRSRTFAGAILGAAVIIGTPALAPPASAQATTGGTVVPVILWAATGAVIGAVAWPMVAGGAAAAAAPAGIMGLGALLNTGAAAGAVLGGGGYLLTR